MAKTASKKGSARGALTERDRFWLEHLKRIQAAGGEAKAYARGHGLSHQALYQAKRRLIERGVWPKPAPPSPPRFVRVVEGAPEPRPMPSPLRVQLPSGALLEWAEAPAGQALWELIGWLR